MTAEDLFQNLKHMPAAERQKFFVILSTNAFRDEEMSHEQLFGHLAGDEFTAQEAIEYLDVSMSSFLSGSKTIMMQAFRFKRAKETYPSALSHPTIVSWSSQN